MRLATVLAWPRERGGMRREGPRRSSRRRAPRWGRRSRPRRDGGPLAPRPGRRRWARPEPTRRSAARASRPVHASSRQSEDPARAGRGRARTRRAAPPPERRGRRWRATTRPTSCRGRGTRTAATGLLAREIDPRAAPAGWEAGTRARGRRSGGTRVPGAVRGPGQPAPKIRRRRPRSGGIPAGVGGSRSPRELNAAGSQLVDRSAATEVGARGGEPLALSLCRESRAQQGQDGGEIVEATAILETPWRDPRPPALNRAGMGAGWTGHGRDRERAD